MPVSSHSTDHLREAQARQRENLRSMTRVQRLDAAMDIYWIAQVQKASALKRMHPDWSEAQLRQALREAFLDARD